MARGRFWLLFLALLAACWPVLLWFAAGSVDDSNDQSGLLAALTALLILFRAEPQPAVPAPLALPCAVAVLYIAATLSGVPISIRALLAFFALASFASASRLGRRLDLPLCALFLLALPFAASLQFYLGYPLRVLAGSLAAALLQSNGVAVVREGAVLAWDGRLISIDAPCSGVKMLWAGLYLSFTLTALYRCSTVKTICAAVFAVLTVVGANALRAAALFYSESGLIYLPPWSHDAAGVVSFLFAGIMIVWSTQWINR